LRIHLTPPPAEAPPQTLAEAREAEAIVETWFPRILYGLVLLLFLVITATLVEMAVKVNGIDMICRPFTSTGELIAFLVGLFTLIVVAYNCGKAWATKRRGLHGKPSLTVARVQSTLQRWFMACCGCLFPGDDGEDDIMSADGEGGKKGARDEGGDDEAGYYRAEGGGG